MLLKLYKSICVYVCYFKARKKVENCLHFHKLSVTLLVSQNFPSLVWSIAMNVLSVIKSKVEISVMNFCAIKLVDFSLNYKVKANLCILRG